MTKYQILGAKKGAKQARTPIIAADSVRSVSFFQGLYGLCEGEILGLADGGKSILLDDTSVINANGEPNFVDDNGVSRVNFEFRHGTNDQPYIKGFGGVENETQIGVKVGANAPFVRTITNPALSAVRVRLAFDALRTQDAKTGDVSGATVEYAIDIQTDGGAFSQVMIGKVQDKTSAKYERSHRIDLPNGKTWTIRVRRITPDSQSELISDGMHVAAITEIIDAKLRYPNTALLALKYDAEVFGNIAKIAVRLKGKLIQVPSNYNPNSRTYHGLWDGTFKLAYSNNPAWVFYDLCTHHRYGLGSRLAGMVDKWQLYQIAQYCDELVPDGQGGFEPRYTLNVYIQQATDAYQVLQSVASIFRGMSFWDGSQIILDSDTPKDAVYTFSRANVVGEFNYQGTRARDRHTVAKVAWDNPNNHFRTEYEFVRDEEGVAKYGIRTLDINAFGCTSKGQAQRAGLWALKSEQLETRTVSFKTGLMGFIPKVGQIINIADDVFVGRATSGRIIAIDGKKLTLDRRAGNLGDSISINTNGQIKHSKIIGTKDNTITLSQAIGQVGDVWAIYDEQLSLMPFKVLSIAQNEEATFDITALEYNADKYAQIDNGAFAGVSTSQANGVSTLLAPSSIALSSRNRIEQGMTIATLEISWGQVVGATSYKIMLKRDDTWQTLPTTTANYTELDGAYNGTYIAKVVAVDAFGLTSLPIVSTPYVLDYKNSKPPKLVALHAHGILFGMELSWVFADGSDIVAHTEIEVATQPNVNVAPLGVYAYPTSRATIQGLDAWQTYYYRGRVVDKMGNASDWTDWVEGTVNASVDKILDLLNGEIKLSHLHKTLSKPIEDISALTAEMNEAVDNMNAERERIVATVDDITALKEQADAKIAEISNLSQEMNGYNIILRELGVTTSDLAQQYAQLKLQSDNTTQSIEEIRQVNQDSTTTIERMSSELDAVKSGFENLRQTLTTDSESLSQTLSQSTARLQQGQLDLTSRIDAEEVARANGDNANAQKLANLQSEVGDVTSKITTLERTQTNQLKAVASKQQQLVSRIDGLNNNLLNERHSDYGVQSAYLNLVSNETPDDGTDVVLTLWFEEVLDVTIRANVLPDENPLVFSSLGKGVWQAKWKFSMDPNWRYRRQTIIECRLSLPLTLKYAKFEIGYEGTAYSASLQALDGKLNKQLTKVESNIHTIQHTIANNKQALAEQITTLQSSLNRQQSSIQQIMRTQDGLSGEYTLKIDVGGRIGGYGITGDSRTFDFAVAADKFYIAPPTGSSKGNSPFMVLTSPSYINGTTVPAGTYINSAFIHNASIDTLKIKGNSIVVPRAQNFQGPRTLSGVNHRISLFDFTIANDGAPLILSFDAEILTTSWGRNLVADIELWCNGIRVASRSTFANRGTTTDNPYQAISISNVLATNVGSTNTRCEAILITRRITPFVTSLDSAIAGGRTGGEYTVYQNASFLAMAVKR